VRLWVQEEEEEAEEEEEWHNVEECVLCGTGGDLLCCDGCPASFHGACLNVDASALPEGDWLCPECSVGGRGGWQGRRDAQLCFAVVHSIILEGEGCALLC